jgi:hypothetical protein
MRRPTRALILLAIDLPKRSRRSDTGDIMRRPRLFWLGGNQNQIVTPAPCRSVRDSVAWALCGGQHTGGLVATSP